MKLSKKIMLYTVSALSVTSALSVGVKIFADANQAKVERQRVEENTDTRAANQALTGEFLLNNNNSIKNDTITGRPQLTANIVQDNIQQSVYGNGGFYVLLSNNHHALIDEITGTPKWVNAFGTGLASSLSSVQYHEQSNSFILLRKYKDYLKIMTVRGTSGGLISDSEKSGFTIPLTTPVQTHYLDWIMTPVMGTNDSYIIAPKGKMTAAQRKESSYQIWINNDGKFSRGEKLSYNWEGAGEGQSALVGLGSIYTGSVTYIAMISLWDSGYYFTVFSNGAKVNERKIHFTTAEEPNLNDFDVSQTRFMNPYIASKKWGDGSLGSTFWSYLFNYSTNKSHLINLKGHNGNISDKEIIDFQNRGRDYDMGTAYMDIFTNKVVSTASWVNEWKNAAVIINGTTSANYNGQDIYDDESYNASSSSENTNKKRVNVYDFINKDIQRDDITSRKILTRLSRKTGKIFFFKSGQPDYWIGDTDIDNYKGNYAYNTKLKNSSDNIISAAGLENDLSKNADNNKIKSGLYLSDLREKLTQYKTTFSTGSVISVTAIKPTDEEYGLGRTKATIEIDGYNIDDVSAGKANIEFIISGFKKIDTTLTQSSLAVEGELAKKRADAVSKEEILSFIKTKKNNLFNPDNLPISFDDSNITIDSLKDQNASAGTLVAVINLNKYYESGVYKTTNKSFEITLTGFTTVDNSTTIQAPTVEISPELKAKYAYEVTEADLKQFVVDNMINSPATGTTASNVTSIKFTPNNKDGTIEISSIKLDKYRDASGQVLTQEKEFTEGGPWQITGFKKASETTALSEFSVLGKEEVLVDDETNETVLNILWDNKTEIFSNTPNNFDKPNITISNIEKKSSEGKIVVSYSIRNYFDANAQLQETTAKNLTITLTGFKSVSKETVLKANPATVITGAENLLPQDVDGNNDLIKKYVKENVFDNLPSGFDIPDISSITLGTKDNKAGSVQIIGITLNKYQDANGNVSNQPKSFATNITVTGFKTSQTTTLLTDTISVASNPDLAAKTTDGVTVEEIKAFIFEKKDRLFGNTLPDGFVESNITEVVKGESSISTGKLTVTIKLDKYYDDAGLLVSNNSNQFTIKLEGFHNESKATLATSPKTNVSDALATELPTDVIVDDDLKTFVMNNMLENKPSDFAISNITNIVITSGSQNNLNGTLEITSFEVNKYLDADGNIKEGTKTFTPDPGSKWTVSGFKQVQATSLKTSSISADGSISSIKAKDITEDQIKEFLFRKKSDLFNSLPEGAASSNIVITSLERKSNEGIVTFTLELNKYYDDKGVETTSPNKSLGTVTLNGLASENLSTSVSSPTNNQVNGVSDKLASDFVNDNEIIKNFIKDNMLKNIPQGLTAADITYTATHDNLTGTLTITSITLKKHNDANGQLIESSKDFTGLTHPLTGFKHAQPTEVIGTFAVPGKSEVTLQPSISDTEVRDILFNNKDQIFKNLPDGFAKEDISVTIATTAPSQGTISVSFTLGKYYDQAGNVTTTAKTHNITLTGYKTSQLNTTLISGSNVAVTGSLTSQRVDSVNITSDEIKTLLVNAPIWNNKPENLSSADIKNIEIASRDDSAGTITISSITVANTKDVDGRPDINDIELTGTITLSGFARPAANNFTSPEPLNIGSGLIPETIPNDIINQAKHAAITQLGELPKDATIEQYGNPVIDNVKGQVTINFKPTKYFDNNSAVIDNTSNKVISIIITGYTKYTTDVNNSGNFQLSQLNGGNVFEQYTVNEMLNDSAKQNQLKAILAANANVIFSQVPNINDTNLAIIPNSGTSSPKEGIFGFTLTLNKHYENGEELATSKQFNITIGGFKSQTSTVTQLSNMTVGDIGVQSTLVSADSNFESVKAAIVNKLNSGNYNIPTGGLDNSGILLAQDSNFTNGEVKFTINLTKYYDENGKLVESSKQLSLTVTGFQKWNVTTVSGIEGSQQSWGQSDKDADAVTEEDVKNIIKNKISSIFTDIRIPGKNIDTLKNDVVVQIGAKDALKGTVEVTVKLPSEYNYVDGAQTFAERTVSFTITGFKPRAITVNPETSTSGLTGPVNGVENLNQVPNGFNSWEEYFGTLIEANKNNIINGLPKDAQVTITVTNATVDPKAGTADVSFDVTINGEKKSFNTKFIGFPEFIEPAAPTDNGSSYWNGLWLYVTIAASILVLILLIILIILIKKKSREKDLYNKKRQMMMESSSNLPPSREKPLPPLPRSDNLPSNGKKRR